MYYYLTNMLLLEIANQFKDKIRLLTYELVFKMKETKLAKTSQDRAKDMRIYRSKLEKGIDESIKRQKPKILLLGPNMDSEGDGSKLRRELKERLWSLGLPVYAEHAEMAKAAKKGFKSSNNLSRLEMHIARNVQLIILIPDSPGSFAELGLFAHKKDISKKLLILFNKRVRGVKKSFIFLGPIKYADEQKVEILPIDYRKIERVWTKIIPYIKKIKVEMADLV